MTAPDPDHQPTLPAVEVTLTIRVGDEAKTVETVLTTSDRPYHLAVDLVNHAAYAASAWLADRSAEEHEARS